jgi:hypothetical protein
MPDCVMSLFPMPWLALLAWAGLIFVGDPAHAASDTVAEALDNITQLVRPGEAGYATISDGNKFVQCRRWQAGTMRCEAAGSLMQPSLKGVLTPERLERLGKEGWSLDPAFGHYVQVFPASLTPSEIAEKLRTALMTGYEAEPSRLHVQTQWVADVDCPPRIDATQTMAGSVSNSPSLKSVTHRICAYSADSAEPASRAISSLEDLVSLYGPRLKGEIQRLRVNARSRAYVIVSAGIGYVQCAPEPSPPALYCEAQSAQSWPALASILTPERIAWLRNAGFSDPGRGPNYWKLFPLDPQEDARTARDVLAVLFEVYGYRGSGSLVVRGE